MTIQKITSYLNFDGDAADAIAFYEQALGAACEERMRFADMPEHPFGPEANDRVMHAALKVGEATFMLSDVPPKQGFTREGNAHLMLWFDDVEDLTRRFEALADGGEVTMPLGDMFWGAKFGMLTDRFGVRWMLTCPQEEG